MKRIVQWLATVGMVGLLMGCASKETRHPDDPLEPMNRVVFSFNDGVDRVILKPVAIGYEAVTPSFFRRYVSNFGTNANVVWGTINAGLQLKGEKFLTGFFRFGVNTIFGFGGFLDIASEMGLDDPQEDFGQTLGYWGVAPGPYIVWPFLGPSTARDSVGMGVAMVADPVRAPYPVWDGDSLLIAPSHEVTNSIVILEVVNLRAELLGVEKAAEGSMLDRYVFFRDAYLQRRENLVYDGEPPVDAEFEFADDEL